MNENKTRKSFTYECGNSSKDLPTITVHVNFPAIPFAIWRDVSRLASVSIATNTYTWEFPDIQNRTKAQQILNGGMWKEIPTTGIQDL